MKATRAPVQESTFTLMALLFLVVMTLFLTSYSFAETRRTRAELNVIKQILQAPDAGRATTQQAP